MLGKDHAGRFWSLFLLSGQCPAMVKCKLMTREVFGVQGWSTDKNPDQIKPKQLIRKGNAQMPLAGFGNLCQRSSDLRETLTLLHSH